MIVTRNCLVCNGNKFERIYNNTLLKCNNCGFVTADMDVSDEVLKSIYTVNYFDGDEYVDYLGDKDIIQKNFSLRLAKIFKLAGKQNIKKVTEIGCAYGFFGELIVKENIAYKGYDIAGAAIDHARDVLKLDAESKDYLQSPPNRSTDIFMWDVIEHLKEPEKFIKKISEDLEAGGRVYITTGDISALLPSIQKEKWRMIHPPSHLHYFSKSTLTKLLANYGLTVINTSYPPIYRSIRQIFYSLFLLKKKPGKLATGIYNAIPHNWFIPINTADIIFIIAEKKG